MPDNSRNKRLTLIKGGAAGAAEIAAKAAAILSLPPEQRVKAIADDPAGGEIVRNFTPVDFYLTMKEAGESDGLRLLERASTPQFRFLLDVELWEKWSFLPEKGDEWLGYLLDCTEERMLELLSGVDAELLVLLLKREIEVAGGVGVMEDDEARLGDWDHSFDGLYMVRFRKPRTARKIGTLLDILHRSGSDLYQFLMEGVKNETEGELEEACHRFRAGRMADLGIPEYLDALSIYQRTDPDSFVPAAAKEAITGDEDAGSTLLAVGREGSYLGRLIGRDPSGGLHMELRLLVTSAIAAEGKTFADQENLRNVLERVEGYLTIALRHLCGDDEDTAAAMTHREQLRRLFSLGFNLVRRVAAATAAAIPRDSYPNERLAEGLSRQPPLFYRGLDPDQVDGYREFRTLEDLRTVEGLLSAGTD